MAGMYLNAAGATLNLNDAGNGTGSLDITSGVQGFIVNGSAIINANITGVGGVDPEYGGSGASLSLFGNNTYSGGTALTSSSTLVYYNNNNSFGSGTISVSESAGSFAPLLATGGSTITLANNFANTVSGSGVNFAGSANTAVISTGNWSLGANSINIRNNGNSTAPLTLTGVISGSGGVTFSGSGGGTIHLNNRHSYTGTTTIGSAGDTAITVELGIANAIASSSSVLMSGGTLNLGGFTHTMTATTLGLTTGSSIDFGAGSSHLSLANSSALTWTGTLDLLNWNSADDTLQIGTDDTGLTAGQLADIEFDGTGLGDAEINSQGFITDVPEASTTVLGLAGGLGWLGLIWNSRRRKS